MKSFLCSISFLFIRESLVSQRYSSPAVFVMKFFVSLAPPMEEKKVGRFLKIEGTLDEYLLSKPGYINCYINLRHIIEPQCAGQQRCEVPVVRIEADSGCSKAFKDHLDIE